MILEAMDVKARLLANTMSRLSEERWCAGWLSGCEYSLWIDLTGEQLEGASAWGISKEEREDLRLAYEVADGWIIWSDAQRGPVALSKPEWRKHLANRVIESSGQQPVC